MSQAYERELKGILMADPEVLKRVVAHLPPQEQIAYMKIIEKPFVVVRAAGSFGVDMAVVDGHTSFLVEEKTSIQRNYNFNSPRVIEQAETLKDLSSRAGVPPLYAYRLKNLRGHDPWRLFSMEINEDSLESFNKYFYDKLPKVERTRNNNYVMHWEKGKPLHEFIDWAVSIRKRKTQEGG